MGWFSPIKGHYPSLGQIDKTLPVADGSSDIQRGMIVEMVADAVNADGAFRIAGTSASPIKESSLLYIALQDYADAQAGMAGTTGFDTNVSGHPVSGMNVTAGTPSITGLSLDMEGEYETDMIASETDAWTGATAGTALAVANGLLKVATPASEGVDGDVVVGYLTSKPYTRWVNNAIAKPASETNPKLATRQGKSISVIRFRTK